MTSRPHLTKFKQEQLMSALGAAPDATVLVVRGQLSQPAVDDIAGQFDKRPAKHVSKYGWTAIELGA